MKMLLKITLLLSAFATGLSLTTIANKNEPTFLRAARRTKAQRTAEVTCESIKNIICGLKDTQIFCEKVTALMETNAELNQKLMGGSSFTVFAPTDDAFQNVTSRLDQLSEKEIEEIILFHFNENVVMTLGDLACTEQLTSLSGDKSRTKCRRISVGVYLKHQRGDGNLDLDQFPIINVNSNEACDGIVHRLDTVMLPKLYKPFKDLVPKEKAPPQMAILPDVEEPIIINDNEDDKDDDEEVVPPTEPPAEPPTQPPTDSPPSEEVPPSEAPLSEGGDNTDETDDEPSEGDDKTEETSDNGVDLQKPDPGTSSTTIENAVDGEETKKKGGIGALGINLIIFSTLLLCFVFVCMRR